MCGNEDLVFLVGDIWHCDECQATGEVASDGDSTELHPPDHANSSRTRVVEHLGRMVSNSHDLSQDESEQIVRYALDHIKWGLPH